MALLLFGGCDDGGGNDDGFVGYVGDGLGGGCDSVGGGGKCGGGDGCGGGYGIW